MIRKLKEYLGQSDFAKNVATLASGTAVSQLLVIAIAPVLTRIYSPEDFGTFGLFSALIGILGVVSTGKYEYAIMLPEKEQDSLSIVFLATFIALAFGLVLLIVVILFHDELVYQLGDAKFSFWIYFVPLGVTFTGLYQVVNFWKNRQKQYSLIAKGRIARSLVASGINVVFGFLSTSVKVLASFGLILGQLVSQLVEVLIVGLSEGRILRMNFKCTKEQIISVARRYSDFAKYDVPSELMITASIQLPVLMLNRFFDQYVVGLYFNAHKVLSLPMTMIGTSIGQVLFKQLSDVRNDPAIFRQLVYKTYSRLMLIGVFPFAAIGVFGKEIFSIVFGSAWGESGTYASLISPWLLLNFVGSPLTLIFSALEKQKQMFLWMGAMFVARIASLWIGYTYFDGAFYSILLFSASGAMFYFSLNYYLVVVLAGVRISDFIMSTFAAPIAILVGFLSLERLFEFVN